jgi:hypothetical protein
VSDGEFAVAVDAVFADSEVFADLDALPGRDGSGPGVPGGGWGASGDGAVWALVVVVRRRCPVGPVGRRRWRLQVGGLASS